MRISYEVDVTLGGGKLVIPRGTMVWVPHHAMHNSIHNWDRPDEFLPGACMGCLHASPACAQLATGCRQISPSHVPRSPVASPAVRQRMVL